MIILFLILSPQESELQVQTTGGYSLSQQGSLPELHNTENDVSDFLNSPKTSTLAYTVDLQEQGLILSWTPRWKKAYTPVLANSNIMQAVCFKFFNSHV